MIVLRDIDQMDYGQIAQTLEIAPGTVKSRLFRARLALRQKMNPATPPRPPEPFPPPVRTGDRPLTPPAGFAPSPSLPPLPPWTHATTPT